MKAGAIALFALADVGFIAVITAGYAVGTLLLPIACLIGGIILLNKAPKDDSKAPKPPA